MGWTSQGFQPGNFDEIIQVYYLKFIESAPEYADVSFDSFKGSEEYRHFYAAAQVDMTLQLMFSGIGSKVAEYLADVNYKIGAPTTTHTEIVKGLVRDILYIDAASMAPQTEANAGTTEMYLAFNVDPADVTQAMKNEIANYLSKYNIVGGNVMIGDQVGFATLDNTQQWPYKWTVGESDTTTYQWRFKIWISRSAIDATQDQEEIARIINARYVERYTMGGDIETEKYWNLDLFPWAADAILEYSTNGTDWSDAVVTPPIGKNIVMTLTEGQVEIKQLGE